MADKVRRMLVSDPETIVVDLSENKIDLSGSMIGDSGPEGLGRALAASSTLTVLTLCYCGITAGGAAHIAQGVRQGPPRRVPLTLSGVKLGSVEAAQVGLGDTPGGWDTPKMLAALNVLCHTASANTGGKHGESAASSRGGRGQSMDVDVERAEERDQDSADKEPEGEAGDGAGASVSAAGARGGRAAGGEADLRRELEAVKRERDAMLGDRARFDAAILQKDEVIRGKDAEIARLHALAYGVEVTDVETGVTSVVVEEAGAGAAPPRKRLRLQQKASAWVIAAAQERLVEVKREHGEERAASAAVHSELRASVDAKVQAAVKEALAQVADALECACCLEHLAPGAAVAFECGHTYCNRAACASSSATACPECRRPIGARVPLFGVLPNVCELFIQSQHSERGGL